MDDGTPEADVLAMQRLQAGEDLALNEIMARWEQPVASYLLGQLGNREDALDLTMETFVRVYESRHRYSPSARFARWIFTIATNLARNHVRWKQRHPEIPLETDEEEESPLAHLSDGAPSVAQQMETKERARAVQRAIGDLPPDLRSAFCCSSTRGFPTPRLPPSRIPPRRPSNRASIGRGNTWRRN
ncbi:MAG: sigma-70 family RNA polymerase sigma factor [Verrucomicrobiota bacterium]